MRFIRAGLLLLAFALIAYRLLKLLRCNAKPTAWNTSETQPERPAVSGIPMGIA